MGHTISNAAPVILSQPIDIPFLDKAPVDSKQAMSTGSVGPRLDAQVLQVGAAMTQSGHTVQQLYDMEQAAFIEAENFLVDLLREEKARQGLGDTEKSSLTFDPGAWEKHLSVLVATLAALLMGRQANAGLAGAFTQLAYMSAVAQGVAIRAGGEAAMQAAIGGAVVAGVMTVGGATMQIRGHQLSHADLKANKLHASDLNSRAQDGMAGLNKLPSTTAESSPPKMSITKPSAPEPDSRAHDGMAGQNQLPSTNAESSPTQMSITNPPAPEPNSRAQDGMAGQNQLPSTNAEPSPTQMSITNPPAPEPDSRAQDGMAGQNQLPSTNAESSPTQMSVTTPPAPRAEVLNLTDNSGELLSEDREVLEGKLRRIIEKAKHLENSSAQGQKAINSKLVVGAAISGAGQSISNALLYILRTEEHNQRQKETLHGAEQSVNKAATDAANQKVSEDTAMIAKQFETLTQIIDGRGSSLSAIANSRA